MHIFKNQHPEDVTLLNFDDPVVKSWGGLVPGRLCWFSRREVLPQGIYMQDGDLLLHGTISEKLSATGKICRFLAGITKKTCLLLLARRFFAGVEPCNIAEVLKNFKGVEHRIEYTATINGVRYYNDSQSNQYRFYH